MNAIAALAALTAYLAVLGVDWSDPALSPVGRGITAAVILDLIIISAVATWAAAT